MAVSPSERLRSMILNGNVSLSRSKGSCPVTASHRFGSHAGVFTSQILKLFYWNRQYWHDMDRWVRWSSEFTYKVGRCLVEISVGEHYNMNLFDDNEMLLIIQKCVNKILIWKYYITWHHVKSDLIQCLETTVSDVSEECRKETLHPHFGSDRGMNAQPFY